MHGTVHGHSNLGRGTGGGYYKIIFHKMQLVIVLPGLLDVKLLVVHVVDLLQDILVHLGSNLWLILHFVVQSFSSLDGAIVVFSQVIEVLLLKVLNRDLLVDGVYGGFLHDGLDTPLFGELN